MNRTLQNTKKQNAESKGDQIQTAIQQIEKIEERLIEKEKDRPCNRRDFERASEATTHTDKTKMFFFFF
jgi:ribosome-associated translation inhibitor RaiA